MRYSASWKYFGSTVEISIEVSFWENISEIFSEIFQICDVFEHEFSRFRPNSNISLLNANKKRELSPLFLELFLLSVDLHSKTKGLFNPLVQVSSIGYSKDFTCGNFSKTEITAVNLNMSQIQLKENILLLQNNQNLDFWGIAKWFFADTIAQFLQKQGYQNFFINAGWDIVAHWHNGIDDGWKIGIENPFKRNENIASILIKNSAVATSGRYRRNWEIHSKKYHHILHPHWHKNLFHNVSATVVAENGSTADAFAKAFFNNLEPNAELFFEENAVNGFVITQKWDIFHTKWFLEKYAMTFPCLSERYIPSYLH